MSGSNLALPAVVMAAHTIITPEYIPIQECCDGYLQPLITLDSFLGIGSLPTA